MLDDNIADQMIEIQLKEHLKRIEDRHPIDTEKGETSLPSEHDVNENVAKFIERDKASSIGRLQEVSITGRVLKYHNTHRESHEDDVNNPNQNMATHISNESMEMSAEKVNLSGNAHTDELTDSELVRKFVTFHFYFPVGRHHPPPGSPILTRENGLLSYKANCDKVSKGLCDCSF